MRWFEQQPTEAPTGHQRLQTPLCKVSFDMQSLVLLCIFSTMHLQSMALLFELSSTRCCCLSLA
jgi:hypothetical protein